MARQPTPSAGAELRRFAESLRDRIGAERVLLFGSRTRGGERADSDYDLIIVSPRFAGVTAVQRATGLRQLWYQVGGDGPMDLICLTPDEFDRARQQITLVAAALPEAIDLLPQPAASRASD